MKQQTPSRDKLQTAETELKRGLSWHEYSEYESTLKSATRFLSLKSGTPFSSLSSAILDT